MNSEININKPIVALNIRNKTSDDRIVKLFDCNELFELNPIYDIIEIKDVGRFIDYKKMLVLLLSSFNNFSFNQVMLIDNYDNEPPRTIIKHFSKKFNGNETNSHILLYKHENYKLKNLIASNEEIKDEFTINNGSYIEYLSKANTDINIYFINKL